MTDCPTCGGALRRSCVPGSFVGTARLLYHYANLLDADDTPMHRGRANVTLCDTCRLACPVPELRGDPASKGAGHELD